MDRNIALEKLTNVVKGYRHADYERTKEVAKWSKQMITGDDQKEILIKFRPRESKTQKEQRVAVYNSRTPQASEKVKSIYNEVHRSVPNFEIDCGGNADAEKKVEGKLSTFDFGRSWDTYITEKQKYYEFCDSNAWLIIDFKDEEIYPFEASSEMALDFKISRGKTEYLVVRFYDEYTDNNNVLKKAEHFILYSAGFNIDLIVHRENDKNFKKPDGYTSKTITKDHEREKTTSTYYFKYFTTGNESTPAMRFGHIKDVKTNGRTFINPLWIGRHGFRRLMWRTSSLDISHALHGFLQKFAYAERCNHRKIIDNVEIKCDEGYLGVEECPECHGTGKNIHTSDQDTILFLLDSLSDNVTPLSNFVHYVPIDTTLIQEQKEEVKDAIKDIVSTIFNEDVFDRSKVATTATELRLNWRSVYNRIYDYAQKNSELTIFATKTIAGIINVKDCNVSHSYRTDFRLETVAELLDQRARAIAGNAPSEILSDIDRNIMMKQHVDNPEKVAEYEVREKFKPLRTMSSSERVSILLNLDDTDPLRIAWLYHDVIFDEIFDQNKNYLELSYRDQKRIFDEKVKELGGITEEGTEVKQIQIPVEEQSF